ncbi:9439_t:CDS:2, partial [Cetraspora pellucida]
ITINEYHLDLIPFEDDLLSLELDNTFKELYLDGDYTSIYYVARALMKLQTSFGLFRRIISKGDCAKHLADMLIRMRREVAVDDLSSSLSISQSVDSLIITDRSVDLITPLCTQLTYEGFIDEVFGIKASHVESKKKKNFALNSGDKLFARLRDINFAVVGGVLNRVAKRINEDYEYSLRDNGAYCYTRIQQALEVQQSIYIYLFNSRNDQSTGSTCLSFTVIMSTKSCKWWIEAKDHNPYASIRKTLRLIVDEVEHNAPLSVRLIQCVTTTNSGSSSTGNGWKGYEEVLKMLPGMVQGQHSRVTLAFFLGGCTYAEISAIRFLAQDD